MTQTLPQTERFHDQGAEGCVLASMILDPRCIPAVLTILPDRSAFFFEEHQVLFDAIMAVWHRDGTALDGALTRSELLRIGQLDRIGGAEYLQAVLDSTPTAANARYYAHRVSERKQYRGMVAALEEMGKVLAGPEPVDEQVRHVQELALGLQATAKDESTYPVKKHATRVALATQNHVSFLPTGLRSIDWYIGGLVPGRLIVPAGRPSMGKTALAVAIALNLAQAGQRVLFFTLEMSADELIERMISVLSGVNLTAVKRSSPDQETVNRFYAGSLALEKLPIIIEENRNTVEQQIATIRHHAEAEGVDVAFVDYLGLMTTGRRIDNRVQEVSMISRQLKLAAVREHIPIVALSQLNRAPEGRENHRPRLSDLRDSGSVEQDADVVMLLHREDYYRRQADPDTTNLDGVTECIIAKHRSGPCGVAKLVFIEETTKFVDLAHDGVCSKEGT